MKGNILGADPGAGGAIALFMQAEREFKPGDTDIKLLVVDMPRHEINGKLRLDLYALARQIREWDMEHGISHAIVENVSAMPPIHRPGQKQRIAGTASSFAFGFSAGALQMAVAAAGIPMTLVVPQVWKKVYGLRGGAENKDMSRQKASMLFPGSTDLWARKKDDGRAEAVLLAHYGSKLA